MTEITAPTTAASGFGRLYAKNTSKPYYVDDSGTHYDLTGLTMPVRVAVTARSLTATDYTFINEAPGASNPVYIDTALNTTGRIFIIVNRDMAAMDIKDQNLNLITVYTPLLTATSVPGNSSMTIQFDGTNWYKIQ